MVVDRRIGSVDDGGLVVLRARDNAVDCDGAVNKIEVCRVSGAPVELILGVRVVAVGTISLP